MEKDMEMMLSHKVPSLYKSTLIYFLLQLLVLKFSGLYSQPWVVYYLDMTLVQPLVLPSLYRYQSHHLHTIFFSSSTRKFNRILHILIKFNTYLNCSTVSRAQWHNMVQSICCSTRPCGEQLSMIVLLLFIYQLYFGYLIYIISCN